MRPYNRALLLWLALATNAACAGGACSTEEPAASGVDCAKCPVDTKSRNLPTNVSFSRDLFADKSAANPTGGILRRACGFGTTCHGDESRSQAGLFLAPALEFSECNTDTSAGACTVANRETGATDNCNMGAPDSGVSSCADRPPVCRCGESECPSRWRCVPHPDGGVPVCGPVDGGTECVVHDDCNGGVPGTCVDPLPECTCDLGRCEVGQRCVAGTLADAGALRTRIINHLTSTSSKTLKSMKLVEPNQPERSFLMLKLDGCHACIQGVTNCAKDDHTSVDCCDVQSGASETAGKVGRCGDRMPWGAGKMTEAERDMIRAWIADGANDN